MGKEEQIRLCDSCLFLGGCCFVNEDRAEQCAKVDCFANGYDRAIDKACEWLEENYPYYFETDIEEQFKKAMEN